MLILSSKSDIVRVSMFPQKSALKNALNPALYKDLIKIKLTL